MTGGPGLAWMSQALCARHDPDLWFPDLGGTSRPAKSVCCRCPVRVDCLRLAVDTGERHGVWGGLTDRERLPFAKAASMLD